jgi:undecaprenyl diphosphate synthase
MSLVEATLRNIIEILQLAIALKLPMLTFQIATSRTEHEVDTIVTLFTALMHEQMLDQHQIKVSVIGKWYELPERAVEPIKHVITATRDYDGHFVNICVRYDGQEEIIDGAKLLAKHVQLGKLAPEQITKEALKEAMLTSTLLPPALIIIPAPAKKTNGVLLWDSSSATVHFSDTPWQDFGKNAFLESVRFFQQHTQSTHT